MRNCLKKQSRNRVSVVPQGPSAAHPIPARSSQNAAIRAEATATHWALMSPELSTAGKVFYPMWLCQQPPGPQSHCEVLCIGNRKGSARLA